MNQDHQSRLKQLIARGKEQGYLTYAEVNDHLPDGVVEADQVEEIIAMINDMGITTHEQPPDADSLSLSDESTVEADDDAAAEAAAALASVDGEFGRTTDPVRMYMREMGTVELLTREGEIEIAKRIEDGLLQALASLGCFPLAPKLVIDSYALYSNGEMRLQDLMVGFIDPNAPDASAQPRTPEANAEAANAKKEEEEDETPVDTGPDLEEVAQKMGEFKDAYVSKRFADVSATLPRSRKRACCRSLTSRKSAAGCPLAKRKPDAPRRKWSKPTCDWSFRSRRNTPTAACSFWISSRKAISA